MACKNNNDYHNLAKRREFQWIGESLPTNTSSPTHWQCRFGHRWTTSFASIQRGTDCPYCSGLNAKTVEDYQSLASNRGFQWTAKNLPRNIMHKTRWSCENNHEWLATYNAIQQGGGC